MDDKTQTNKSTTDHAELQIINHYINESPEELKEHQDLEATDILDRGFAWFIVLVGFFINFIIFGTSYSYAVLLSHYKQENFGNPTILIFVGTINVATVGIGSLITGRIDKRIGHRLCLFIGGFIFSLGLLSSSWAKEAWHLILTQGLVMGFGGSMAYVAAVSAVVEWFDKRRGIAVGMAVSGSGIGGLILAPVLQELITNIKIEWTLRLYSIFTIIVLSACSLIVREPKRTLSKNPTKLDFTLLKNPKFILMMLSIIIFAQGFLIPIFSMSDYGISLGFTKKESALFVGLLNGAAAVGRISNGIIADRFGAINVASAAMTLTGLCILLIWSFAKSFAVIITFCLLYGLFSSSFASLPIVISVQIFGSEQVAIITSFIYVAMGTSNLMGAPLANLIRDLTSSPDQPTYMALIVYSGIVSFVGSALMLALKIQCQTNGFFSKI